jgi:DNA-binding response OmpR family regulator
MSERILIVEDEVHIAQGLQFNLELDGYQVETVETGEAALEKLLDPEAHYDVVVLDVMLPGKNGFAVAHELRTAGQFVPVLMLTARGRPEDILEGFAAGADDYLPKPFELAILIARVKGLIRRREWFHSSLPPSKPALEKTENRFVFGDKTIQFDVPELRVGEQAFPLTLMEANILRYLVEHEGRVVSRKTMLHEVWGLHEDTDTRAIDNFIVRLRRYIEAEPTKPAHLLTVRGIGYRFVAFPEQHSH